VDVQGTRFKPLVELWVLCSIPIEFWGPFSNPCWICQVEAASLARTLENNRAQLDALLAEHGGAPTGGAGYVVRSGWGVEEIELKEKAKLS
jgi:hypothetical protein